MSELNWKTKIGVVVFIVALIGSLLLIIKYQHDTLTRQDAIAASIIEQRDLIDGIQRSQASYATKKDMERFSKEAGINLEPIKKDLKKFDAKIEGISKVRIITRGFKDTNRASDQTISRIPGPTGSAEEEVDYGYLKKAQVLKLNEPFGDNFVPWGEAKFSAWREKPWDLEVFQREYSVVNVLGTDEEGRHYVYNKFTVETNGEAYVIDITESKFVEEYPTGSFSFNPALYLGIDGGVYVTQVDWALAPNITLSLASYGKTKVSPDWIFFNIGAEYEMNEEEPALLFSPVNYNVGKHIPLMDNTYIGPSVSLDSETEVTITLGLKVGL